MRPRLLVWLPGQAPQKCCLSTFLLVCALVHTEQMEQELKVNAFCYQGFFSSALLNGDWLKKTKMEHCSQVVEKNLPCSLPPRNDFSNVQLGLPRPAYPTATSVRLLSPGAGNYSAFIFASFSLTSFSSPCIWSADPGRIVTTLESFYEQPETELPESVTSL